MEDILFYEYGIDIEGSNLLKINDNQFCFYLEYRKYYFYKTELRSVEIEDIINIINTHPYPFNIILKTLNGKYCAVKNGEHFVLTRIIGAENAEIDVKRIIEYKELKNVPKSLNRSNWGELWAYKIDSIEKKLYELKYNDKLINNLTFFYKGLAENAIYYFNNINIVNCPLAIQHKRIYYPTISKDYYNPLSIIIDYRVRDIAEYIKSLFWNSNYSLYQIFNYLDSINLNDSENNLLYIRLLFPTNYLDDLEVYINDNSSYSILKKYDERCKEYIIFLRNLWIHLNKKSPLQYIKWIIEAH